MNNWRGIVARLDFDRERKMTRAQCLEVLRAPRGASMVKLAERLGVHVSLVRHVRYNCKWMIG